MKTSTQKDPVRRLAHLERILGPQIEQAEAAQEAAAARERAQVLAERERDIAKREKAAVAAQAAHRVAAEQASKAAQAAGAAQRTASEAWAAAWAASYGVDRARTTWDQRLAELGLQVIDGTIARLRGMAQHARNQVRFTGTVEFWGSRFYPTGKTEIDTPVPLQAAKGCDDAIVEIDALRYADVGPAEIERRCRAAEERCIQIGGPGVWGNYTGGSMDLSAFVAWVKRTTDEPALRDE
ncbi:MAG: hypothetical protein ABS56_02710 [Lautropia sp. SCN 69-89]|nr:MAG: hypothetical protein ABS56_02710 [Lautropia sp. SCN 69-89]